VSAGVDPNYIGREIFGMNDWFANGATADYCTAPSASVPFSRASDAYCGTISERRGRGKVVLSIISAT